jgi:type I restriction enzyme S subunit
MSNKGNPMFMPKRRFPEFKEAGEWHSVPLNRLAVRTKQKNRDEKIVRVLTNSAEFGVMDQRDFFDKDIATQGNLESYYVVELGSYVYNPRISAMAPVGPISKNKIGTGVMSPLYTVFKFKDESNDFYEHYFKTTGWHGYMRHASSTGARHDRMAISSEDFMAMPLPVSTPKEQQKIADCLSSLDELITAQGRKVEALKTHKKGLMQQLFPREGETQPRLRFPEFRGATLQSVFLGGVTEEGRSRNGNKHSSALVMGVNKSDGIVPMEARLIATDIARYKLVERDWFAYNPMRLNIGSIARWKGEREILVSPDYVVFKCITNGEPSIVPDYLDHFRHTETWNSFVKESGDGSVRVRIYYKDIAHIGLALPSPSEQQKIANCLTSLHTLITTATLELETLKTHKKGLMQQLFPSLEVGKA